MNDLDAEPVATVIKRIKDGVLTINVEVHHTANLRSGTLLYTRPASPQPAAQGYATCKRCTTPEKCSDARRCGYEPAAPVELPVVGALWEFIGKDPMNNQIKPCSRALHEMNPDDPPYPDTWRVVDKVVKLSDAQAQIEFLRGVCQQHAKEKVEMGRRIAELEAALKGKS